MKIFQVCALQPHFDNNINCRAGQGKLFKTPIFERWGKQFCLRNLFKSTLNNRLHRNLACVIDKSSRGAKLERAFEELP